MLPRKLGSDNRVLYGAWARHGILQNDQESQPKISSLNFLCDLKIVINKALALIRPRAAMRNRITQNVRKIWDMASEIDLLGYLGHSRGLNEIELRKLSTIILRKLGEKGGFLLNAGCGICSYDVYLSSYFKEIIAIDVSPKIARKAIERVKSFNAKNISIIVGDVRFLPLRAKTMDACISLGVIKHIPEQPHSTLNALKEINRVVKGAVYVNDLPNLLSIDGILYKIAIIICKKILGKFTTGTYLYMPSYLNRIFQVVGCKKITWYGCGWAFPLSTILNYLPLFKSIAGKLYVKPVFTNVKSDKPFARYSSLEVLYHVV